MAALPPRQPYSKDEIQSLISQMPTNWYTEEEQSKFWKETYNKALFISLERESDVYLNLRQGDLMKEVLSLLAAGNFAEDANMVREEVKRKRLVSNRCAMVLHARKEAKMNPPAAAEHLSPPVSHGHSHGGHNHALNPGVAPVPPQRALSNNQPPKQPQQLHPQALAPPPPPHDQHQLKFMTFYQTAAQKSAAENPFPTFLLFQAQIFYVNPDRTLSHAATTLEHGGQSFTLDPAYYPQVDTFLKAHSIEGPITVQFQSKLGKTRPYSSRIANTLQDDVHPAILTSANGLTFLEAFDKTLFN